MADSQNPVFTDNATVHGDGTVEHPLTSSLGAFAVDTNGVPNHSQAGLNFTDTASVKWSNPSGVLEEATVANQPYDVAAFAPGLGSNAQKLLRIALPRAVKFPAGAALSTASASVGATGSTTYTFRKNGTPFATVNFAIAATTGVFTQAADETFAAGDILEIDGPGTADATLSDVGIVLAGVQQ